MSGETEQTVTMEKQLRIFSKQIVGNLLARIVDVMRNEDNIKKMKNMSNDEVVKELQKLGFPNQQKESVGSSSSSSSTGDSKAKPKSSGKKELEGYESKTLPGKSASQSKADAAKNAQNLSIKKWYNLVKEGELLCGHAKKPPKDSGDAETVCSSEVFNPDKTDIPSNFRCCSCNGKVGIIKKMLLDLNGAGSDTVKVGTHNKVKKNNIPSRVEAPSNEEFEIIGETDWYMFGLNNYVGFVFMNKNDDNYCIGKYLNSKGKGLVKDVKSLNVLKDSEDMDWQEKLEELTKKEQKELKSIGIKYLFQGTIDE